MRLVCAAWRGGQALPKSLLHTNATGQGQSHGAGSVSPAMFHILDMHSKPAKGYRAGTLPVVGTVAPDIKENSVLFCKMGVGGAVRAT